MEDRVYSAESTSEAPTIVDLAERLIGQRLSISDYRLQMTP